MTISPIKILIVDDMIENIEIVRAILSGTRYDLLHTTDSMTVTDIVARESPNIVLMDVSMPPGKNGIELCEKIKLSTNNTAVVLITANPEHKADGLNAGADDFLTKPVRGDALLARLRALSRLHVMINERKRHMTNVNVEIDTCHHINALLIGNDVLQMDELKDCLTACGIGCSTDVSIEHDIVVIHVGDHSALATVSASLALDRQKPVIALLDDDQLLTLSLDVGASDCVLLPLDDSELIARIRTQVHYKRYLEALTTTQDCALISAYHDPLTKTRNRRYLQENMERLFLERRDDGKLSIIMIDIDKFKDINDTLGHLGGDKVLADVAGIISSHVIGNDDYAARYGGEELVVVLNENNVGVAYDLAEHIRSAVEACSVINSDMRVTISAGVTSLQATDRDFSDLIARADSALYKAKRSGRNRAILH